ncbi:MAG: hypothetical protein JST65_16955 [Acidobacteria bacterium]|nr:hypothetical protein [Acidobacteriota bacterium]
MSPDGLYGIWRLSENGKIGEWGTGVNPRLVGPSSKHPAFIQGMSLAEKHTYLFVQTRELWDESTLRATFDEVRHRFGGRFLLLRAQVWPDTAFDDMTFDPFSGTAEMSPADYLQTPRMVCAVVADTAPQCRIEPLIETVYQGRGWLRKRMRKRQERGETLTMNRLVGQPW